MIGTTNKEILQIDENSWKFPKTINFGSPSTYTKKFNNLDHSEIIIFDPNDTSDILGHVRIDLLTKENLETTDLVDVPPSVT